MEAGPRVASQLDIRLHSDLQGRKEHRQSGLLPRSFPIHNHD